MKQPRVGVVAIGLAVFATFAVGARATVIDTINLTGRVFFPCNTEFNPVGTACPIACGPGLSSCEGIDDRTFLIGVGNTMERSAIGLCTDPAVDPVEQRNWFDFTLPVVPNACVDAATLAIPISTLGDPVDLERFILSNISMQFDQGRDFYFYSPFCTAVAGTNLDMTTTPWSFPGDASRPNWLASCAGFVTAVYVDSNGVVIPLDDPIYPNAGRIWAIRNDTGTSSCVGGGGPAAGTRVEAERLSRFPVPVAYWLGDPAADCTAGPPAFCDPMNPFYPPPQPYDIQTVAQQGVDPFFDLFLNEETLCAQVIGCDEELNFCIEVRGDVCPNPPCIPDPCPNPPCDCTTPPCDPCPNPPCAGDTVGHFRVIGYEDEVYWTDDGVNPAPGTPLPGVAPNNLRVPRVVLDSGPDGNFRHAAVIKPDPIDSCAYFRHFNIAPSDDIQPPPEGGRYRAGAFYVLAQTCDPLSLPCVIPGDAPDEIVNRNATSRTRYFNGVPGTPSQPGVIGQTGNVLFGAGLGGACQTVDGVASPSSQLGGDWIPSTDPAILRCDYTFPGYVASEWPYPYAVGDGNPTYDTTNLCGEGDLDRRKPFVLKPAEVLGTLHFRDGAVGSPPASDILENLNRTWQIGTTSVQQSSRAEVVGVSYCTDPLGAPVSVCDTWNTTAGSQSSFHDGGNFLEGNGLSVANLLWDGTEAPQGERVYTFRATPSQMGNLDGYWLVNRLFLQFGQPFPPTPGSGSFYLDSQFDIFTDDSATSPSPPTADVRLIEPGQTYTVDREMCFGKLVVDDQLTRFASVFFLPQLLGEGSGFELDGTTPFTIPSFIFNGQVARSGLTGACCSLSACTDGVTGSSCDTSGDRYQGDGTTCAANPCNTPGDPGSVHIEALLPVGTYTFSTGVFYRDQPGLTIIETRTETIKCGCTRYGCPDPDFTLDCPPSPAPPVTLPMPGASTCCSEIDVDLSLFYCEAGTCFAPGEGQRDIRVTATAEDGSTQTQTVMNVPISQTTPFTFTGLNVCRAYDVDPMDGVVHFSFSAQPLIGGIPDPTRIAVCDLDVPYTIGLPTANAGPDHTLCPGGSVTLTSCPVGATCSWDPQTCPGSIDETVNPPVLTIDPTAAPGSCEIEVTAGNACGESTNTATITITPASASIAEVNTCMNQPDPMNPTSSTVVAAACGDPGCSCNCTGWTVTCTPGANETITPSPTNSCSATITVDTGPLAVQCSVSVNAQQTCGVTPCNAVPVSNTVTFFPRPQLSAPAVEGCRDDGPTSTIPLAGTCTTTDPAACPDCTCRWLPIGCPGATFDDPFSCNPNITIPNPPPQNPNDPLPPVVCSVVFQGRGICDGAVCITTAQVPILLHPAPDTGLDPIVECQSNVSQTTIPITGCTSNPGCADCLCTWTTDCPGPGVSSPSMCATTVVVTNDPDTTIMCNLTLSGSSVCGSEVCSSSTTTTVTLAPAPGVEAADVDVCMDDGPTTAVPLSGDCASNDPTCSNCSCTWSILDPVACPGTIDFPMSCTPTLTVPNGGCEIDCVVTLSTQHDCSGLTCSSGQKKRVRVFAPPVASAPPVTTCMDSGPTTTVDISGDCAAACTSGNCGDCTCHWEADPTTCLGYVFGDQDACNTTLQLGNTGIAVNCGLTLTVSRDCGLSSCSDQTTTSVHLDPLVDCFVGCPPGGTLCPGDPIPGPDPGACSVDPRCAPPTLLSTNTNGGTCPEIVTYTYGSVDPCGETDAFTQVWVRDDTEAPILVCDAGTDSCAIPGPDPTSCVVTDNCQPPNPVSLSQVDMSSGHCPATLTRTWTARDSCDNIATFDQIFSVYDGWTALVAIDMPPSCPPGTQITLAVWAACQACGPCDDCACVWTADGATCTNAVFADPTACSTTLTLDRPVSGCLVTVVTTRDCGTASCSSTAVTPVTIPCP